MNLLKILYRGYLSYFYYTINYFKLKKNQVTFVSDFKINGYIYINNKGKIQLGKLFQANSGKNHNPIGGDTILRLITQKSGKITIGDNCGISNTTIFAANEIRIGNNVMIGGGCKIWDTDFHPINAKSRVSGNDSTVSKPIIISDNVFIGGGAILLKGILIGENVIVGAGSVVTKSIPSNEIWGGNPAKLIKTL